MVGRIHIYNQAFWHSEAVIVGDEKALRDLRDSIDRALEEGIAASPGYVSDGEGYTTFVIKLSKEEDQKWDSLRLPYDDEMARGNDGEHPLSIVDTQKLLDLNDKVWEKSEP